MKKALAAMSGGVDSSVAAYLAIKDGVSCVGGTMRLFDGEDAESCACCNLDDALDAKEVCRKLGIDHFVFNLKDKFESEVINRFVAEYERGGTPNPCIDCNRYLKFSALFDRARVLDCEYIVTGHYARIEKAGGRYLLKRAADLSKDQSYVLYSLSQAQLSRTLLPLGGLSKARVREIAESLGFVNADKPDSQDICFVPDGDYAAFIERRRGAPYPAGNFVDESGRILGRHRGVIRYTVGQRKGLGLSFAEPMYVKQKRAETNEIVLCPENGLYETELFARDFNWIAFEKPQGSLRAEVKTRYRATPAPATVFPLEGDRVKIVFDAPVRAITRGQAAVAYAGDIVVGGGVIE